MTEKMFPIMQTYTKMKCSGFSVPWTMAEKAYQHYPGKRDQSLERLAERGGLSWYEFCLMYCGLNPFSDDNGLQAIVNCTQKVVEDMLAVRRRAEQCSVRIISESK